MEPWAQQVQEVTNLQIEVTGCASGYRLVTAQTDKITLYRSDRGCRLKLHAFHFNGELFKGGPLEGPVGTSAIFQSQTSELQVFIASMIQDPIQDEDTVAYSIAPRLDRGMDKRVLQIKFGETARVRRKQGSVRVPHFKLKKSSMIATLPETRSFGMSFDLECIHPVKHEKRPDRRKCATVRLRDISYILVEDQYEGRPSLDDMDRLFKDGSLKVDPDEDYHEGDLPAQNGGFHTARKNIILRSPTDTVNHPEMILILKSHGGYQYFNIDFELGHPTKSN